MCCPGDFPPRSFALAVVRKTLSRWRMLADGPAGERRETGGLAAVLAANLRPFLCCLGLASLTIASGFVNVFFVKELPQALRFTT